MRSARIAAVREIAPLAYSLRLRREAPFVPGQCLPLSADAETTPRLYSIASAPADPDLEILFDLVERGCVTPRLAALAPGDPIWVGEPTGAFRDAGREPAVWVAAGTGIAPFLSMVKAGAAAPRRLVHGSRTLAGFFYRGLLEEALGEDYTPCCSLEAGPGVFAGRLTAYLAAAGLDLGARYLLCGSPSMVVDTRDLLVARGVPFERILSEIYF